MRPAGWDVCTLAAAQGSPHLVQVLAICVNVLQQTAPDGPVRGSKQPGQGWHHPPRKLLGVQGLSDLQHGCQGHSRCATKLQRPCRPAPSRPGLDTVDPLAGLSLSSSGIQSRRAAGPDSLPASIGSSFC